MNSSKVLAVFQAADATGDGVISREKLASAMKAIGFNGDINRLFEGANLHEDAEISYEEFVEWIECDGPAKELATSQANQGVVEDNQTKEARLKKEIEKLEEDLARPCSRGRELKLKHNIRDIRKLLPSESNIFPDEEEEVAPEEIEMVMAKPTSVTTRCWTCTDPAYGEVGAQIYTSGFPGKGWELGEGTEAHDQDAEHITPEHLRGPSGIFTEPDHVSLPDGSRLLERFREVFEGLQDGSEGGVTPERLEQALKSFAKSLPKEVATRINIVVADIFEKIDVSRDGVIQWEEFEHWLHCRTVQDIGSEEAIATLFGLCDADDDGMVSAEELMNVFLLVSKHVGEKDEGGAPLTPEVAQAIVRDLDCDGSGGIEISEFVEIIRAVTAQEETQSVLADNNAPHLVLNFDVNNTVIMFDSASASNIDNMLSCVAANTAWGKFTYNAEGQPESWEAVGTELSPHSPASGLKTYSEFVQEANPLPDQKASGAEEFNKIRSRRRKLSRDFTESGAPGEAFRPQLEEMRKALLLPENVKGTEKAVQAGLTGDTVSLLPGFLNFIRELKRSGRSFSLIFRTFGYDLGRVVQELNAFCEGRHPCYSDDVVLDGSDGQTDYRARLHCVEGCGTFFRDPATDFISLTMGTIEQPETIEEAMDFIPWKEPSLDVVVGQEAVSNRYAELCSFQGTIALRDFYPGWKQTNFEPNGGKPFFLHSINDPSQFAIFFDDHISPACPKIVDPINPFHYPRRYHSSQLFGLHLVQAQPLYSILNPDYFIQTLQQCEAARQERLARWSLAKRLLGGLVDVHQLLSLFAGESSTDFLHSESCEHVHYVPWSEDETVKGTSTAETFEEVDPNERSAAGAA